MGKKIKYFEALRGVAILMVVGAHTAILDSSFEIFIRQIINSSVPIFFALSGYFLYKKSLNTKEQIYSFWRNQIPKVYVPVLIWSLPRFIPHMMHGKLITALLQLFCCGYSIYYFVAVIIQFYLLLPLLQRYKFGNKPVGGGISCCISLISVVVITYIHIILGIKLPLIIYAGFCLLWLWFFVIGCKLSQSDRQYSLLIPIVVSIIGIIASFFEARFLIENYESGEGIKPTSFIFSAGVCYVLLSARLEKLYDNVNGQIANVIEYLGKNSFVLYLLHIHLVKYVRSMLGMTQSSILNFFVVLTLSIVMIEIMKKLIPSRYQYYLGIYQ